MEGWISLHRKIMNHWLYEEKRVFSRFEAWIDLILAANHKDTRFPLGNEIIEAKRGQVITSELKLMEKWGWSKTKLRNFLELCEKDGMIVKKSDRKKTTITIVNYGDYQNSETTERLFGDHTETTRRPREDTINNDNNDNNEISISTTTGGEDILEVYVKTFKSFTVSDNMKGFISKLLREGHSEEFIKEVMYECGESSERPNFKLFQAIAERWIKDGITSREENRQRKQSSLSTKVKPFEQKNSKPKIPISDTPSEPISDEEYESILNNVRDIEKKMKGVG